MMRNSLIHVVLALLLLVGVGAAYPATYSMISHKASRAHALTLAIAQKNQDAERVAQARATLSSLSANEAYVAQYFVQTSDIVSFLERLQQTGKDLKSTVEVVSVAADTQSSNPHLNLSLKISGSFDSIVRTVGSIEYGPYDSTLQNLTLDTAPPLGGTGPMVWTATALVAVGTQPPRAATTTP